MKAAKVENTKLLFDSEELLLEKVNVYLGVLVNEVEPLLEKSNPAAAKFKSDPSN